MITTSANHGMAAQPALVVAEEPNDDTGLKPAPGSLPSPCQNEYVHVVPADLRLAGVLETVLYYASDQQGEMERFYEDVLGLESLGLGRWSLAFRLGQGVVLLFDRERSSAQEEPPPHGGSGSIHAAFLAAPGEYDAWKERLADRGRARRYLAERLRTGHGPQEALLRPVARFGLPIPVKPGL